ncbi:hypothetical protein M5K25_012892 [Dendrobium thyrsiflorum]|uniref:Reverse transcriptase zinc-binding domain-containing protein n=1 Tax=Dendrobium thyrsiflorum TaxID=117978 RepID=A0ABD0V5I7_DENTH
MYSGIGYRRGASSTCKILANGNKFLKKVVRWRIGNGCSIDIYKDIWILDKSLDNWHTFVATPEHDNQIVDKLISDGYWNVEELKILFREDLISLICGIQILPNQEDDCLELIHQNFGCSVSALAYKASVQDHSSCFYWECLKNIKLRPRVEVFWWRIFNNAIPTFQFLFQRRIQGEFDCPRGSIATEDLEHITLKCVKLVEIICYLNKWGFGIPNFKSFQECWKWMESYNKGHGYLINIYCSAAYLNWRARNRFLHEGKDDSAMVIATNSVSYASISYMVDKDKLGHWGTN